MAKGKINFCYWILICASHSQWFIWIQLLFLTSRTDEHFNKKKKIALTRNDRIKLCLATTISNYHQLNVFIYCETHSGPQKKTPRRAIQNHTPSNVANLSSPPSLLQKWLCRSCKIHSLLIDNKEILIKLMNSKWKKKSTDTWSDQNVRFDCNGMIPKASLS